MRRHHPSNGGNVVTATSSRRAAIAALALAAAAATILSACTDGGRGGTGTTSAPATPTARPVAIATLDPDAIGVKMLGEWSASRGPRLPGTLYFADGPQPGLAGDLALAVLKGGTLRRATVQIGASDTCALASLSFSPNGAYVAWVAGDPVSGPPGPVVVTEIATGTQTVFDARSACQPTIWFPDSLRLALSTEKHGLGALDVTSGAFAALPGTYGGYHAWAPGGAYRAYDANGEIVVERADGTVVHHAPYDIDCCAGGFTVQRLSADGRRVGVTFRNTDPGPARGAAKVVDATTGRDVRLPVAEAAAGQLPTRDVHFLADGGLIIRTPRPDTLHVVDASGRKTATVNQPVPGALVMVTD
jgi:TolB protein